MPLNSKASLAHLYDDAVIIPALGQQLNLLGFEPEPISLAVGTYFDAPSIDLDSYDHIIVCISGKDSIACLLAMIEQGVDMSKVELSHHRWMATKEATSWTGHSTMIL
jgi:hypothetical protein